MFNFTQNVYVLPKIWMMNNSFSRKSGAYGIGCKSSVRFIDLDFFFNFFDHSALHCFITSGYFSRPVL